MKTLKDLITNSSNYSFLGSDITNWFRDLPYFSIIADLDLEEPKQFIGAFTYAIEISNISWVGQFLIVELLKQPMASQALSQEPQYAVYAALSQGLEAIQAYFRRQTPEEMRVLCLKQDFFKIVYSVLGIRGVEPLLLVPSTEAIQKVRLDHLSWAASKGDVELLDRLLALPKIEENAADHVNSKHPEFKDGSRTHQNEALLKAIGGGHLLASNRLLKIEAVAQGVLSDEINTALIYAAIAGSLPLFKRIYEISPNLSHHSIKNALLYQAVRVGNPDMMAYLLTIPEVKSEAAANNNDVLKSADWHDEPSKASLLLANVNVRRAYYDKPLERSQRLDTAVVGALWYALQTEDGFNDLQDLDGLRAFASTYLSQNPDWVAVPSSSGEKEKLVKSLINQVLSPAYYKPGSFGAQSASNQGINLPGSIFKTIGDSIRLPRSLKHFEEKEFSLSYKLASKLLENWSHERQAQRRQADANPDAVLLIDSQAKQKLERPKPN